MNFKIIKLLMLLILLSGLKLRAQELKFGFQAGFVITESQLTNKTNPTDAFRSMSSFSLSGYIGYKSSGIWGISAEPGFIQKGGIHGLDLNNENIRLQLNYIQIPILANIYLSDKIFISIGPEFAYLLSAKAKSKVHSNDISNIYNKRFEISGLLGFNYNIIDNIDIGLRYNHGLTNIQTITISDSMGYPLGEMKEYNQYFQLILRFKI